MDDKKSLGYRTISVRGIIIDLVYDTLLTIVKNDRQQYEIQLLASFSVFFVQPAKE